MTMSRFFAPRKTQKKTFRKDVIVGDDGWEKPVGLTKEEAIAIDDSSDDGAGGELDVSKKDAQAHASVLTISDTEDILGKPATRVEEEIRSEKSTTSNVDLDICTNNSRSNNVSTIATVVAITLDESDSQEVKEKCEVKENEVTAEVKSNPFLKFAHDLGGCGASYFTSLPPLNESSKRGEWPSLRDKPSKQKIKISKSEEASVGDKKAKKRKRKRSDEDIKFSEMTVEQLSKCRNKWQSFADGDAPLETQRFQVLIAARLHCQCHDNSVRKAMIELRNFFLVNQETSSSGEEKNGVELVRTRNCLCADSLANAIPEDLAKIFSFVLFANVKSKHIVLAAKEVKNQFHGKVPETISSLKSITGIGPKLADLLFYVNSYSAYENNSGPIEALCNSD